MINAVEIENADKVVNILNNVKKTAKDMRPYYEAIISDYFKSNEALIFSASPGKYADLKPKTKDQKQRKFGFVYPMLVSSGRLKESMTNRGSSEAIVRMNKLNLELGTKTPYASYLQDGTSKMEARPPVLIDVGGRQKRWERILKLGFEQDIAKEVKK